MCVRPTLRWSMPSWQMSALRKKMSVHCMQGYRICAADRSSFSCRGEAGDRVGTTPHAVGKERQIDGQKVKEREREREREID